MIGRTPKPRFGLLSSGSRYMVFTLFQRPHAQLGQENILIVSPPQPVQGRRFLSLCLAMLLIGDPSGELQLQAVANTVPPIPNTKPNPNPGVHETRKGSSFQKGNDSSGSGGGGGGGHGQVPGVKVRAGVNDKGNSKTAHNDNFDTLQAGGGTRGISDEPSGVPSVKVSKGKSHHRLHMPSIKHVLCRVQ